MKRTDLASRCNGARGPTASIMRILSFVVLGLTTGSIDTRPNVSPSTVIQRFLLLYNLAFGKHRALYNAYLAPEQIGVWVFIQMRSDLLSYCNE